MKKTILGVAVAVLAVVAVTAQAGRIVQKTTGPSGQGDLVFVDSITGTTNLDLGSNGVVSIYGDGSGLTNLTGTASANGTTLNALNLVNCTNLPPTGISGSVFSGTITNGIGGSVTSRIVVIYGRVVSWSSP